METEEEKQLLERWNTLQEKIAQEVKLPKSELFDSYSIQKDESNGEPSQNNTVLGACDENFVHTDFLMPIKEMETHFRVSLQEEGEALQSTTYPGFTQQLRFDAQQQLNYLKTSALAPLTFIGGIDISFVPDTNLGVACLAVLRFPSLEVVEVHYHHCELTAPYRPGYLAFRELEPVTRLFQQCEASLREKGCYPQLLFLDGCGVLHPRRAGLATHLGHTLGVATIGCAKKILSVEHFSREYIEGLFEGHVSSPLAMRPLVAGEAAPYRYYGYALQNTHSAKRCVFVSPGHKMGYALSLALVSLCSLHRVPEPTRQADLRSREYIRNHFPHTAKS
ncbi:deoxyribonuclease V [Angomonas deanei]|nr:deoxyribonuclease V [Angomonas deanei]|eukprot:EPY25062.1 deoxyribonuclease V [Angomonas deanei]